ncbi:MAG: hypothetical protein WCE80_01230 [Acidimicrobiia bacterium]
MPIAHQTDHIDLPTAPGVSPRLIRFCALATLLIPVVAIPGLGILVMASSVDIPRNHGRQFLDDLAAGGNLAGLAPWLLGAIPLLSMFLWLGAYWSLRTENRPVMQVAAAAGLVSIAIQSMVAVAAAVIVGHILPAWADSTDPVFRAALASDFNVAQWVFDAALAMFDMFLFVAQVAAAVVMLQTRGRIWTVAAWLGLISGALNVIGVFTFAADSLNAFATAGFFVGMAWVIAVAVSLFATARSRGESLGHGVA